MSKIICNVNVLDIKDLEGDWRRSWNQTKGGITNKYFTRGGVLWSNLKQRCKQKDNADYIKKSYEICTNEFEDFNTFVDWCHEQHGYMSKDSSNSYWCLDKDILIPNNKAYSTQTCVFCPQHVNKALIIGKRGDYPVGVNFDKGHKKFMARYKPSTGVTKYLGYFNDPLEAHKAWQKAKIRCFEELLLESGFGYKLEQGLTRVLDKLKFELLNAQVTTHY